jgi:hypothetical protein
MIVNSIVSILIRMIFEIDHLREIEIMDKLLQERNARIDGLNSLLLLKEGEVNRLNRSQRPFPGTGEDYGTNPESHRLFLPKYLPKSNKNN